MRISLRIICGVMLCTTLAIALAMLFRNRSGAAAVPFAFLLVIMAAIKIGGKAAGIASSVVAAYVFATYLFRPFHQLAVADSNAEAGIVWMLFAGIALSWFTAEDPHDQRQQRNRGRL